MKIFLDFGANVSQADCIGMTPLHICAYYAGICNEKFVEDNRILQCIETLILHGADVSAKTISDATRQAGVLKPQEGYPLDAGLSPLDVARHCGHPLRREAVTKALQAAILKRDAAAGRTPNVETGS